MSAEKILVTGGAGFIGSHLVDRLLQEGYAVRILDNLSKPTHEGIPSYLPKDAEFLLGDVRRPEDWDKALKGVSAVFHEAAAGGFTPDISLYAQSNAYGTALLMEKIASGKTRVEKVMVASSVAVYGEGSYCCARHREVHPPVRSEQALQAGLWEQTCPHCAQGVQGMGTPEGKPVSPEKVYSISKYDQERTVLAVGRETGVHAVALRYFLTYGPRQSLGNPYTGICSIFSGQIANGVRPRIFEDGGQLRDFVYVGDVVQANMLVLREPRANGRVFNVGTGRATNIHDVAKTLIRLWGKKLEPLLEGHYRLGEVRHIYPDITALRALGFKPSVTLEQGLKMYMEWLAKRGKIEDKMSRAYPDLLKSGVIRSARKVMAAS